MEITNKLIEKSQEAFIMAIEIYNKPSIRYRVEGFSFFMCNAWELMLKAHLIQTEGEQSIYYKDNPNRTISLENCIQKIFTNDKDPLRRNLLKIVELRNTSTHFITEEYEMVYIPLFQACTFNFIEKMQAFHAVDITEIIPQNFLNLSINIHSFNADEVRAKYPPEIAERLISINNELTPTINENNDRFAISIQHNYYITKNQDIASTAVKIDSNSDNPKIRIVKELKNPNNTHKYTCKKCCTEINKRLDKFGIPLKFNMTHFTLFCKVYGIKENEDFCFITTTFSNPQYSYSAATIDLIVDEIKKDPENIIQNLKSKIKKS